MKTKTIISVITASLLFSSSLLLASGDASQKSHTDAQKFVQAFQTKESHKATKESKSFEKESQQDKYTRLKNIVHSEYTKHQQSLKKAPKELLQGVEQVLVAIKALDANRVGDAQTSLNKASELFDKGLKSAPQLDMFPVSDTINVDEFTGDAELVAHVKEEAIKLLKDNDTQAAVDILEPLQDEMVMTTKFIPVDLYPLAIKSALKDIKAGQNDMAFNTLITALNTVVTEVTIIPIPLATAQDLVLEASHLKKSNKKEALSLLNIAQDELQKAIYLGYTKKHESSYKAIEDAIKDLKTEIKGKNAVEKLYDNLLNSFKDLKDEHIKSK